MKVKCEYCDNYYDGEATECPHCGGPNEHIRRTANNVPHTIAELRGWAEQFNLPLDEMRVHIGEDYKGAKAFGIYKDGERVVVYKNKANGERAVRYEGTDEAYAVHELYQKMREMLSQPEKTRKAGTTSASSQSTAAPIRDNKRGNRHPIITMIVVVYIIVMVGSVGINLMGLLFSAATGSYRPSYGNGYYSDYDYYDSDYGYYSDDYDYDYYDSGSSYDYDSSWDYDWDDYDFDYSSDWGSDWDWDSDW